MSINVKRVGRAYKYITDAVLNNYSRHTLPWAFDKTKAAIVESKNIEYEADKTYPIEFYEALGDVVLRWCFDGYRDTGEDDIYKIFLQLWQFHKKWLLYVETKHGIDTVQMDKNAADEIANLCKKNGTDNCEYRTKKITDLYVAVMEHVIGSAVDIAEPSGEKA